MRDLNVLRFPVRPRLAPDAAPAAGVAGSTVGGRGKVAFLDVAALAEEPLLRILAMNGVTALVDLRPVPVFGRPKFRHRHVVFYLHDRDIAYIEYAFIGVRSMRDGPEVSAMRASDAYGRIEPALERGLSLCLYDQAARELGWVDDVRRVIRHSRNYQAELHPRALSGLVP